MLFAIAAIGGVVLLLLALKLFAKAKARPTTGGGLVFETSASNIEKFVQGADKWIPHLTPMPLFWVATFFTLIILMLDFHFGHSRGGLWGLIVLGSLFATADLAIPFVALYDATDDGKRSIVGTSLLIVFTVMSYMVVIGSTAEISTTTGAKTDVGVSGFEDLRKQLKQKQDARDSIQNDRGAEALAALAKATEEAADREGARTRCGDKCEKLKAEAKDYRAREKEQIRKEKLNDEIGAIKAKLESGGTDSVRTDSDPMATFLSEMSGGYISRNGFRAYGLTFFGLAMVTGLTLLWYYIGGKLLEAIEVERQNRYEIADETRANLGLPPKYTVTPGPLTALPPPTQTASTDPSITINVQVADMLKRFANDTQLAETNALFDTLMEKADGGSIEMAKLYRAYQVRVLTENPNARYMTQVTLAQKVAIIARNRDDVRMTADGMIQGWILKPTGAAGKQEATANV